MTYNFTHTYIDTESGITKISTQSAVEYEVGIKESYLLSRHLREILRAKYPTAYVKFKYCAQIVGSGYWHELDVYRRLEGSDMAPTILAHGITVTTRIECVADCIVRNMIYTYIAMTNCGKSILDRYNLTGNVTCSEATGLVVDEFLADPTVSTLWCDDSLAEFIDEKCLNRTVELVYLLATKYGVHHADVHLGNFVIDSDDVVRVIDFEEVDLL